MIYILTIIGIIFLTKGADYLTTGASALAERIGVSKLLIGLTIVSLGTTLPELIVSVFATRYQSQELVFGNVIGSCITNLFLILGLVGFITQVKVEKNTTWKEIPFALLAAAVLAVLAFRPLINTGGGDNIFTRTDGLLLLLFLSIFIYYVFELVIKNRDASMEAEIKEQSCLTIIFSLTGGCVGLYLGGEWVVNGAISMARSFGISEFLISATIVAGGTSLPELATAISAIAKKNTEMAVGNILGSNILNIFWVLGLTSVIYPLTFSSFIKIDVLILLGGTSFLFLFMFTSKKHELDRWEGLLFILGYFGYITFLIIRG